MAVNVDLSKLPAVKPTESFGQKTWRILTHPITESLGINPTIDKFLASNGKAEVRGHVPDRVGPDGKIVPAHNVVGPAEPSLWDKAKGFVAGSTEAVTPGHVATALALSPELMALGDGAALAEGGSTLGLGGVPTVSRAASTVASTPVQIAAGLGNAAMAGEGAAQTYKDINDPNASKGKVALDVLNTGLGVFGAGKSMSNISKASKAAQATVKAATPVKDVIQSQFEGLLNDIKAKSPQTVEELLKTKYPELGADVAKKPGGIWAKKIYGEKGAPPPPSPAELHAQNAANAKATEKAADQAVKLNANEAAADVQVNESGLKAQADARKAAEKELNDSFKQVEKDNAARARNTATQQRQQAQEGVQQTRNEDARNSYLDSEADAEKARQRSVAVGADAAYAENAKRAAQTQKDFEAAAQQAKIDALKAGDNIETVETPVRETKTGIGPDGERQSQTTIYREKPPAEGGEGGAAPEPPPAPPEKPLEIATFHQKQKAIAHADRNGGPSAYDVTRNPDGTWTSSPKEPADLEAPPPTADVPVETPVETTPVEAPPVETPPVEPPVVAPKPKKGMRVGKGKKAAPPPSDASVSDAVKARQTGEAQALQEGLWQGLQSGKVKPTDLSPEDAQAFLDRWNAGPEGTATGPTYDALKARVAPPVEAPVAEAPPVEAPPVEGSAPRNTMSKAMEDIVNRRVNDQGPPTGMTDRRSAQLLQKFGGTGEGAPVEVPPPAAPSAPTAEVGTQPELPVNASGIVQSPEVAAGMPSASSEGGAVPARLYKSPVEAAAENYVNIKGAKAAGEAVPEEGRAIAGKAAARITQELADSNPDSSQLAKLPEGVRESLIQKLFKKFQSEQGGKGLDPRSESGSANVAMAARLAGGSLGGIYGYQNDPLGNPLLSATVGAGAGYFAPDIIGTGLPKFASANAKRIENGLDAVNNIHNTTLLSPLSVFKKAAGDIGGLTTAAIENPGKARAIARMFTTPEGRSTLGQAFKEGFKGPMTEEGTGLENFNLQNWQPSSLIGKGTKGALTVNGKTMGGLTHMTKTALGEAGFTPQQQRYYTLTDYPSTKVGESLYNAIRGNKILQHLSPFARIGVNRLERGIEYSPFSYITPKIADPEVAMSRHVKALIGTTVGGAAYAATPDNFVRDHPTAASSIAAFGGPLGIPIMVGMAAKQIHQRNPDETISNAVDDAAKAVGQDIPGLRLLEDLSAKSKTSFLRNYLSGYTNITRPAALLYDKANGITTTPDVSSKNLPVSGRIFNRMLSNIPVVRDQLPTEGAEEPFTVNFDPADFFKAP